jgi:hypothetical protein
MEENGGFMTEFGVPPILTRRTLYAEIELLAGMTEATIVLNQQIVVAL